MRMLLILAILIALLVPMIPGADVGDQTQAPAISMICPDMDYKLGGVQAPGSEFGTFAVAALLQCENLTDTYVIKALVHDGQAVCGPGVHPRPA